MSGIKGGHHALIVCRRASRGSVNPLEHYTRDPLPKHAGYLFLSWKLSTLSELVMSREASGGVPAYAGEKPHKCMQAPLQCNRIAVTVRAEAHPEVLVSLLDCIVFEIRCSPARLQAIGLV